MYPLFETICIEHGRIMNAHYHEQRFANSYFTYYGKKPPYTLFEGVVLTGIEITKTYKLKISYDTTETSWAVTEYRSTIPTPTLLQLVFDDAIAYALKFTNREKLDSLYAQRNDCNDVLIVQNGFITDASYANILFKKGERFYTPKIPLLHGTCRARLLATKTIQEKNIHFTSIAEFDHFQLINAMNDYNSNRWIPIDNIQH